MDIVFIIDIFYIEVLVCYRDFDGVFIKIDNMMVNFGENNCDVVFCICFFIVKVYFFDEINCLEKGFIIVMWVILMVWWVLNILFLW